MSDQSGTHDPTRTLSGLSEQLAQHDKPIAFFFGAGTSCSVKKQDPSNHEVKRPLIPAVAELTGICREEAAKLGDQFGEAWAAIEANCVNNGENPNVANVLSRLRMMVGAVSGTDTLSGLQKKEIKQLEESVRRTIATVVAPDLQAI